MMGQDKLTPDKSMTRDKLNPAGWCLVKKASKTQLVYCN